MNNGILTTQLNNRNKTTVLAKNDKTYGIVACTYVNNSQALRALSKVSAMGLRAGIYDTGRVKFIVIAQD